ncbi:hypothetical protein OG203_24035 [Nocardia sp. NBC_01499]|uniref:hypothetical protein n=1 Tax=Nocardia sp. NBC_01499 TaxID=2903597 RepID=UPI00386C29C3
MTIHFIDDLADGFDRDDIDAATHLRSVRRCHLERRGLDSVTIAIHLLAETGEAPGWDDALDQADDADDSDWDWAA